MTSSVAEDLLQKKNGKTFVRSGEEVRGRLPRVLLAAPCFAELPVSPLCLADQSHMRAALRGDRLIEIGDSGQRQPYPHFGAEPKDTVFRADDVSSAGEDDDSEPEGGGQSGGPDES